MNAPLFFSFFNSSFVYFWGSDIQLDCDCKIFGGWCRILRHSEMLGESRCVTENDATIGNQSRRSFFPWQALASREIWSKMIQRMIGSNLLGTNNLANSSTQPCRRLQGAHDDLKDSLMDSWEVPIMVTKYAPERQWKQHICDSMEWYFYRYDHISIHLISVNFMNDQTGEGNCNTGVSDLFNLILSIKSLAIKPHIPKQVPWRPKPSTTCAKLRPVWPRFTPPFEF